MNALRGNVITKRVLLVLLALALVTLVLAAPALAKSDNNFVAHLRGANEVPANDTLAVGQAVFKLSGDGTEITYRLIVSNLANITQAHIHLAPAGANGGVVAWLYPDGPPQMLIPGASHGVLATGTITAADLVNSLAGQPLSELVDAMRNGGAYVNVHTSAFPGGEIRGQIR